MSMERSEPLLRHRGADVPRPPAVGESPVEDAERASLTRALAEAEGARRLLEAANARLVAQAAELEEQAVELEVQAVELETQTVALQEANITLQDARLAAEAGSRAKSEFLTAMSHELRTPLNAIGGYSSLLAMGVYGTLSSAQLEAIHRIDNGYRQLLTLVNDALNLARIDTDRIEYHPEDVRLAEVLAELEPTLLPLVAARDQRYTVHASDPGAVAHADRHRVQQIVVNLLTNAAKFTERGGEIAVVATRGMRQSQFVHLSVSDTGCGIPGSRLTEIFEPFVQVGRTQAVDRSGVGLGLAISRDLARRMGGNLTVESTVGEGSTFTLTLPHASTRGRGPAAATTAP